jgi:hypothetical protein
MLEEAALAFYVSVLDHFMSHITTTFVRLDMKRGPYFGVVYPVSHLSNLSHQGP